MNPEIAITGATSPIGRRLINSLGQADAQISTVYRDKNNASSARDLFADIGDPSSVGKLFSKSSPRTVIHLAHSTEQLEKDDPASYKQQNLNFAIQLATRAAEVGCPRFIYASSAAVYGDQNEGPIPESAELNPSSHYAELKAETEFTLNELATSTDMEILSLRIFNVYGPGLKSSLINRLRSLEGHQHLNLLGPENFIRDYVHVDDVASAAAELSMTTEKLPRALNVGTGLAVSNKKLLEFVPTNVIESILITESTFSSSVADVSLLKSQMPFEPRSLDGVMALAISSRDEFF